MPKTKILIALLLSIAIVSLIIGCPTTSDSTSDDSGTTTTTTIDTTAPTLISVAASGTTITLVYSETIDRSAATFESGKGFAVTTGADEASATKANVVELVLVDGKTLSLEVTDLLTAGEVVKVAYIADTVIDIAGNQIVAGSKSATITADTTSPTVLRTVVAVGTSTMLVIFTENILFKNGSKTVTNPTGIRLKSGSSTSSINALESNTITSAIINGTGLSLTLTNTLTKDEKFILEIDKDEITDVATNKIEVYTGPETIIAEALDISDPKIDGDIIATSGEKTVTITFTENVTFADGKTEATAAPAGITVKTGETSAKATTANAIASAKITDKVLVLTLAAALPDTGVVKVAFRGDAILDTAKNNLVAITKEATLAAAVSQTEFYFYTDKTGKKENYAPTLTFFAGYENTITGAEQTAYGADGTAKYQTLTGTGGSWASGGWNDAEKATVDLSTYNTLVFWVKSAAATSFVFRMEDVNENHESAPAITRPVTTAWVKQEISFAEFGISDASKVQGLVYTLAGTSDAIDLDEVYVYNMPDTTAPTVVSSAATGGSTSVAVTFSEAIGFGSGGSADGTGFTITDNTVTAAAITDKVLTLTVGTALPATGTFKVAFASNAITDKAATPNAFAGADSGDITITAVAPTEYYFYTDATDKTEQTGLPYAASWDNTIAVTEETSGGANGTSKYRVLTGAGAGWAAGGWQNLAAPVDLSAYNTLVFWAKAPTATSIKFSMKERNEKVTTITSTWTKYEIPYSILGSDGIGINELKYVLSNTSDVVHLDEVYLANITATDTKAPTASSTTGEGGSKTVTVTFSENIRFGFDGNAIGGGMNSFTGDQTAQATANAVTAASISGTTLTLIVTNTLTAGEYVKVAFGENVIADIAGNSLANGTNSPAGVISADSTAPTIATTGHIAEGGESTVQISFSEDITFADGTKTATSAPAGITVTSGATGSLAENVVTRADIANNMLTLVLTNALVEAQSVKVAFTADAIKDIAGTKLVAVDTGVITITASTRPIELATLTFENSENFVGFDGGVFVNVTNPSSTGINTSANVIKYTKSGTATWAGGGYELAKNIDFSTKKIMKIKVYGPAGTKVVFKMEGGTGNQELEQTISTADTWEELAYDFSSVVNAQTEFKKIVIILNNGTAPSDEIIYIDDISQNQ